MPAKAKAAASAGMVELEHSSIRAATVVWVKQRSYPWWPAMVTYDPDTGQYSQPGKTPDAPPSKYHVQFFGEDPMRAWVGAKTGIRIWDGPQGGAEELRERQKIPKSYLASWPTALEQAETAYGLNYTQRLQMFATDFRETKGEQLSDEKDAVHASYSSDDSEGDDEEPEQIWVTPDDPNKPKKATSAYFFFTGSRRESLTKERPELAKDVTQIAKALGAEWAELDETARQPFVEQAEADKLRYAKQMESYVPLEKVLVTNPSKTQKRKAAKAARKKNKDKNAPKRGAGPYFLFTKDARPKLAAEFPDLKITEIAVKLGQMWKELSEAEQKKYYDLASVDKERYAKEMETYVPPPQAEPSPAKKKPIGKREAARKEKEKKERKRKRQEEAEKAELKEEVGRIWQTILEIEVDGKNWLDTIQSCAAWPCDSDHREELGVAGIEEKLEQWSKPAPEEADEEEASPPSAEGADGASAGAATAPAAAPPPEYTPAQFSKDVEAMVAAVQAKAEGTAADKMPSKLALLCKELLVDLKAKTSKKSGRVSKNELQNDSWCDLCEEGGVLICCEGGCTRSFHPSCLGLGCVPKGKFVCDFCKTDTEVCFLCGGTATSKADMLKCEHPGCGKFYHKRCKKELPRVRPEEHGVSTATGFVCPRHVCANSNLPGTEKWPLVACIRCPIAYHDAFLPAGCTPKQEFRCTICPRHTEPGKHPSTPNCMVCEGGGSLVCCDTCPGSFHLDCIRGKQGFIEPPEGDTTILWSCPECINGTKPCVDDIVWAKVGNYRWWPAKIRALDERPEVLAKKIPEPGQFAVCYYGTNEWGFQSHACTVSWELGDERRRFSLGAKKKNFSEAVEEAKLAYDERLQQREAERGELIETVTVKPMQFKKIKSNKAHPSFVEDKAAIKREREELQECNCSADSDNPCGPDCLNREMYIECDPKSCPCGQLCKNRRIQQRQTAKIQTYKTADKGFGLRTNEQLEPGDLITEYCGEVISSSECADRLQKQGAQGIGAFYMVSIDAERIIDAGPMGNLARFANHSCDPNMVMQKWNVLGQTRVGLFACKEVKAEDELTWNYNLDAFEGHKKLKCFCGAGNCSGWIGMKKPAASSSAARAAASAALKEEAKAAAKKPAAPVELWKGMRHPTHFKSSLPDLTTFSNGQGEAALAALRKLGRNPFSSQPLPALKKLAAGTKRKAAAAARDSGKKSKKAAAEAEAMELEADEEMVEEWVVPKDPNRPKRGLSAFFYFLQHERERVLADKPELKVQEVAKVMGAEWAKMSSKAQAKYVAMAEKDKARYAKEMKAYVPPPKVKVMVKRKMSEKALAKREKERQQQQQQLEAAAGDAQGAAAARPVSTAPNDGFSIWGKGRTELGPASDEEDDAELSAAAAAAAAADAAAASKPKAKRVAKYLRQTSASGGGSADESSEDELEDESAINDNRASASVAPVHNIWAAKAQQKQQDKQNKGKGKGKGKGNAAAQAKKQPVGAGGTKGVKRAGGAAGGSAKPKRPRPAGSRSSSRHSTISPVFADTVRGFA